MTVLLGAKALAQTWLSALVVVILVVSTTVTAGTSSWIRTVSLQDFNDHFEWNSFCVASTPNAAVETPQVDVYKDLITGEIKLKDDSHDGQHDLSLGGRDGDLVVDSRFNATTCDSHDPLRVWVERVQDEAEWQRLVDEKMQSFDTQNDNTQHDADADSTFESRDSQSRQAFALWVVEIDLEHHRQGPVAIRALRRDRDLHLHRKVNSSAVFAIAYLTVEEAHQFALEWQPNALFPVPNEFKLAPSAFLLVNNDLLGPIVTADDDESDVNSQQRETDWQDVEILTMLHLPAHSTNTDKTDADNKNGDSESIEDDSDVLSQVLTEWTEWLNDRAIKGKVVRAGPTRLILQLPRTRGRTDILESVFENLLLPHAAVVSVEARPRFKIHNQYAAAITQNGTLSSGFTPIYEKGLSGAGQVVGVGDSGLDVLSCFFREAGTQLPNDNQVNTYADNEKVVQYVSFADNVAGESGDHGTHVAGTVAGFGSNGEADTVTRGSFEEMESYKGVAFNAKIAFFDMGVAGSPSLAVPGDLYNDFLGLAYQAGAFIHTNSWGTDVNQYTTTSRDMDRYSYDHQDYLVLVAAGNSGSAGIGTLGSPATGKNMLSVGASMTSAYGFADAAAGPSCSTVTACTNFYTDMADNIASFSSLGPSFDGRMKPDVVAPGFYVMSAYSSNNVNAETCAVEAKSGTSMATPVTAGSAALVREYFVNQGIVPMGALVKAALIHSAHPLTGVDRDRGLGNPNYVQLDGLPDTNQGFGLVSLQDVLAFEDTPFDLVYFGACSGACEVDEFENLPNVDQGTTFEHKFTPANTAIVATLVWHDPEASSFTSNSVLINDLDLEIEAPDGNVFLPYLSDGTTGVNTLDNAEKIVIPVDDVVPDAEYTVRVKGTSVAVGPQPFALVLTFKIGGSEEEQEEQRASTAIESLQNQGGLGFVVTYSPGIAAALCTVAILLLLAIIIVLVICTTQGKWAGLTPPTPAMIIGGVVVRGVELILALAMLALVVRDSNTIAAADPTLAFPVCGGAGAFLVALGVLVAVHVILVIVLFIVKMSPWPPVGVTRFVVMSDILIILLLVCGVFAAAIETCGDFSLFNIPAAIACCLIVLYCIAVILAMIVLVFDNEGKFKGIGGDGNGTTGEKGVAKTKETQKEKEKTKGPTKSAAAPAPAPAPAASSVEIPVETQKKEAPPLPAAPSKKLKAEYDYNPTNPDELQFIENDEIELITVVDDGWAKGRNTRTNKVGLFPRNYVSGS